MRYQKKLAPSMLRNWKAMLMQTPISDSVTISRTIVPVLLATAPNWDSAASAKEAVGCSDHPADNAHHQLPCASQISRTSWAQAVCAFNQLATKR